MKFDPL